MGLPKGRTNNTVGRPSDPQVREFREAVRGRLNERLDRAFDILDKLKGKAYLEYFIRFSKEVMPPLMSETTEAENNNNIVNIFEQFLEAVKEKKAS